MHVVASVEFKVTAAELTEGAYVVTLDGDADPHAAPSLARELEKITAAGPREIIVDLLDVSFIDSSVLGVLLRTSRRLQVEGADVVLVSDDPRVLRAFEITGLGGQFRFQRTLAAAVESWFGRA